MLFGVLALAVPLLLCTRSHFALLDHGRNRLGRRSLDLGPRGTGHLAALEGVIELPLLLLVVVVLLFLYFFFFHYFFVAWETICHCQVNYGQRINQSKYYQQYLRFSVQTAV